MRHFFQSLLLSFNQSQKNGKRKIERRKPQKFYLRRKEGEKKKKKKNASERDDEDEDEDEDEESPGTITTRFKTDERGGEDDKEAAEK